MSVDTQAPAKNKAFKIFKIVGNVLLWLFVAFSIFVTILVLSATRSADGVPSIGGKSMINVLTPSMEPTIGEGDIIIATKLTDAEKQNLSEGDIISYHFSRTGGEKNEINTHRIESINRREDGVVVSYVTKGDNNIGEDKGEVYPNDIIAIWDEDNDTRLPAAGKFISFLQTSTGFLVVIVLPLVAFFIYELIKFILTILSVKNDGKKQISAADEELIKQKAIEEYLRQQREAEEAAKAETPADESNGTPNRTDGE